MALSIRVERMPVHGDLYTAQVSFHPAMFHREFMLRGANPTNMSDGAYRVAHEVADKVYRAILETVK